MRMTPLEEAARRLVQAMNGVSLTGKPEPDLDAIIEAHRDLFHRLHHIEFQRDRRNARKAKP
jgi:hypothetical protein